MKIYIAGPYTKGDVILNIRNAIWAGDYISHIGHVPYIPHLNMLWHMIQPHEPNFWYQYDFEWLKLCDAVLRLEGESIGADKEVDWAIEHDLTLYHSVFEIPIENEKNTSAVHQVP